jgi:hypothetical protein
MLIRQRVLDRIVAGEVTLAFRRWRRPTVKAGGSLRTAVGVLAIDAVDPVHVRDVTRAEALAAGYESLAELHAGLGRGSDGQVYRIRVRLAGADPRIALRGHADLTPADLERIDALLDRLDASSPAGPWTMRFLQSLKSHPGMLAATVAARLGLERMWLKTRVRRMKELGLTESLEVGYGLSPRGSAYLAERSRRSRG